MNPNENKPDIQSWIQPIQQHIGRPSLPNQRQISNPWLDSVQAPIYEPMHKTTIMLPPNTAGNAETPLLNDAKRVFFAQDQNISNHENYIGHGDYRERMASDAGANIQGEAESLYQKGQHFLHVVRPREPVLAFDSFTAAASLGSKSAKHMLAYMYQHGVSVEKDEKSAVGMYMELAAEPNPLPASLNQLGICFQMGIGVETDQQRAFKYYQRAVELGNKDAMFNMAYCLRHGIGVQTDYEQAFQLYLQMAKLGDPQAMHSVGKCMWAGIGTTPSEHEALKYFKAASQSDNYWGGKVQYAILLINGIATESDPVQGFKILRETCKRWPRVPGSVKIQLGRCYHYGLGVQVNLRRALKYYHRAMRSYCMPMKLVQECEWLIDDATKKEMSLALADENGAVAFKEFSDN